MTFCKEPTKSGQEDLDSECLWNSPNKHCVKSQTEKQGCELELEQHASQIKMYPGRGKHVLDSLQWRGGKSFGKCACQCMRAEFNWKVRWAKSNKIFCVQLLLLYKTAMQIYSFFSFYPSLFATRHIGFVTIFKHISGFHWYIRFTLLRLREVMDASDDQKYFQPNVRRPNVYWTQLLATRYPEASFH